MDSLFAFFESLSSNETAAIVGLAGLAFHVQMWVRRKLQGLDTIPSYGGQVPPLRMPPSPPPAWREQALADTIVMQHISKGRDSYGQVIESVALRVAGTSPTPPQPRHRYTCAYCLSPTSGDKCQSCGAPPK